MCMELDSVWRSNKKISSKCWGLNVDFFRFKLPRALISNMHVFLYLASAMQWLKRITVLRLPTHTLVETCQSALRCLANFNVLNRELRQTPSSLVFHFTQ
jgi:hypothetical protein